MENLFSLLRRDHARLRAFTREGHGPLGGRPDGLRRLARQWAIHFLSEENFLFPRLSDDSEVRPLLRSLAETHALVRRDIRGILASSDEAKSEELRARLLRAVDLEEEGLLRMAEQIISPDEAMALGRDVEDFRADLESTLEVAA